ncbi:MAG: SDR family NAD(P)-dependent oxidoreductase [Phycisphaerales bacterium]|nr:SDR family NAD(P)-dependent oxidoreductase [Phycisphaerales bacterium]
MTRTRLAGRPILITGASSGIGAATARACAGAGMPVVLCARRLDRLERLAAEIRVSGGRAIAVPCDVTDPASCRAAVGDCIASFGSIYAVFANAGYAFEKATLETTDAEFRAILETNFWGTVNIVRPAVEAMTSAECGHVIACSSCLSKIGLPFYSPYTISKAAQDHWTRALRLELRAKGIRASTIHPIGTRTELFDEAASRSGGALKFDRPDSGGGMHSPERVASKVLACLRRPKPEVWLSAPMRLALGLSVACPRLADRVLRRMAARRGQPLD